MVNKAGDITPMVLGALIMLLIAAMIACVLCRGHRRIQNLNSVTPADDKQLPPVSIIVAARNEQRNIREALQSLLQLTYPDYELIVVNDRSEDGTQAILEELADKHPHLKIVTIRELPPGWMGKNHAHWLGSHQATGSLLLFTDADIFMEASILQRAVTYFLAHRLDHLAATPAMRMPSVLLGMFGVVFIMVFSLFARPWKARDQQSPFHIGIGAFNLVRAEAYRQVGGHQPIALRPDDDMKLGKLLKHSGYQQDVVYAPDYLAVEWYASTGELIRGLEKNAFAGAEYSVPLVIGGTALTLACGVWPFIATVVTEEIVRKIYLLVVVLTLTVATDCARFHRMNPWYALGYPLASLLMAYIMLRTMLLNLVQGGIYWRGTFYPLRELKKNRI